MFSQLKLCNQQISGPRFPLSCAGEYLQTDCQRSWILETSNCYQQISAFICKFKKANKKVNLQYSVVKVLRLYFSEFLLPLLLSIWTVYLEATIECSGISRQKIETRILSLVPFAFRFWLTCRYLFIQIKYPQCCLLYIFDLSSCQRCSRAFISNST